ncbi:MAG: signal peptidase I, partial [Planctomycetes bacterium]|nr:signal peptidase I [Planctomycetota bacterium]
MRALVRRTALAAALLLAVLCLLRYGCTPYRIPSPSMLPGVAPGDVVLSDAVGYWLRPPRRWDVAIFRHPPGSGTFYIKRVVGLPGETVAFEGGDVWVDGRLVAKPEALQETAWSPLLAEELQSRDLLSLWRPEGGEWRREGEETVVRGEGARLRLGPQALDGQADLTAGAGPVGRRDYRLRLEIRMEGPGRLEGRMGTAGGVLSFRLQAGGEAPAAGEVAKDGLPLDRIEGPHLAPGPWHRLAFDGADGILRLDLDGRRLAQRPYGLRAAPLSAGGENGGGAVDAAPPSHWTAEPGIEVAVSGTARFRRILVDRDRHYFRPWGTGEGPYHLPRDGYLFVGDNTLESRDPRYWPEPDRYVPRARIVA